MLCESSQMLCRCDAVSGTDIESLPIALGLCYAVSGTELAVRRYYWQAVQLLVAAKANVNSLSMQASEIRRKILNPTPISKA
eukprot:2537198-Rhodomonas_salina.5